jgi:luciferase-type oxidoreductase
MCAPIPSTNDSPARVSGETYERLFRPRHLTVGLMFPIEAFAGDMPTMEHQVELAQQAEAGSFAALWVRDVPLRVPSFGDVGQIFDPFVYLGFIAAQTTRIALGTAAIILPLHHPLHIAKAAASIDHLSGGRLILGVASGDRPAEFPAFGQDILDRGEVFRQSIALMRVVWQNQYATVSSRFGHMEGVDLIPKPPRSDIPLLIAGHSQQSIEWIATHSQGWLSYPRPPQQQKAVISQWRNITQALNPTNFLPFAQSLYIDLSDEPNEPYIPIHLGYRLGREALVELLLKLRNYGVNHVALNLKYGSRPAREVLTELIAHVLPRIEEEVSHCQPD